MSGSVTGMMVETRNITRSQVTTMESLQEAVNELKGAMLEIKDSMTGFLVNHNALTQQVNRLSNGESTSRGVGHHVGDGIPNTRSGNRGYGRMSKIEFPQFNGEDVKGWVYRCTQFFKSDGVDDGEK